MVLFLNLVVPFFVILVGFIAWKTKNWKCLLAIPFAGIIYTAAQPSYIPKGDISRSEIPGFVKSEAEIVDNARKPLSSEDRNAAQEREYKNGLVFIEKN